MTDEPLPVRWAGHGSENDPVPGIAMDPPLSACPHCGGDVYHVRLAVSGTIREHHAFDRRRVDNMGMWDTVIMRQRRTVYCSDCERPIAKALP